MTQWNPATFTWHRARRWFPLLGLVFQLAGAIVVTLAARVTLEDAVSIGVSRFAGDTQAENLQLPAVQNLLNQYRSARIGLMLVVIGTAVQIPGAWPHREGVTR